MGESSPRHAVIFDLDGTLLNTGPDLIILTNYVLREFDMPEHTGEEILSYVGNGAKALMLQAVPEGTDPDTTARALARWKELYPELAHATTEPYEGIVELVTELGRRGIGVGVLSNKFDAAVQSVVAEHFAEGTFGAVHGECDEIPRKPDPAGLLRTIGELSACPETTIYVGDSVGDVVVARNAGCRSVAVTWGYNTEEALRAEQPTRLAHTVDELAAALSELAAE